MSDYIDTPTRVRVFNEDYGWSIDGVDDAGGYTEAVWDSYDGRRMTRDQALAAAPEFAAAHGWSELPIFVKEQLPPISWRAADHVATQ